MKSPKATKIKKLDKVFSSLVRGRVNYTCENCNTYYPPGVGRMGIHCSHLWGRAKQSTRYHPLNAFCHCLGCHNFFTANPVLFAEWAEARLGPEEFANLRILAHQTIKRSKGDKEDLYDDMKAALQRMDAERIHTSGRIEFSI